MTLKPALHESFTGCIRLRIVSNRALGYYRDYCALYVGRCGECTVGCAFMV